MAKTDVKLYSTDTYGKVTTATITDVNPDATSSQLVQMGRLFNNLTQNTYTKTDRINTINCDTEGGGAKQDTTLTLAQSSISLNDLQTSNTVNGGEIAITTNSDGVLYIQQLEADKGYALAAIQFINGNPWLKLNKLTNVQGQVQTQPQTITIYQAESETHKAATASITITA